METEFITSETKNIFLSALVPVIGFTLSTLSLRCVRRLWEKSIEKKKNNKKIQEN